MRIKTNLCVLEYKEGKLHLRESELGPVTIRNAGFGLDALNASGEVRKIRFTEFSEAGEADGGCFLKAAFDDEFGRLSFVWAATPADDALTVVLTVTNDGPNSVRLRKLVPLYVRARDGGAFDLGEVRNWSFFRMGWQSWSTTRAYRMTEAPKRPRLIYFREMEENPPNCVKGVAGHFVSEQTVMLSDLSSGRTFACGFLTCLKNFGDFRIEVDGGSMFRFFQADYHLDDMEIPPGMSASSEPLRIEFSTDAYGSAKRIAHLTGAAMKARIPAKAPVGWCSWYHYYTHIDENEMRRNLRLLTDLREKLDLSLVQLDDGYQTAIGDWISSNKKFPSGVPSLLKKIRESEFKCGIWTAPFLARPDSELFRNHRDWFLKDEKGGPRSGGLNPLWGGRVYALDPTHPEAREHLRKVFKTLREEWGADFIKIDFCYAAALPAKRYDPFSTRASALRLGLQTIRSAVGDAFILGCGCPLGPAVGIVDAMRIGCDVTPKWHNDLLSLAINDENVLSAKHALRNILTRAFLQNEYWLNDPDCLMIRRRKSRLTDEEVIAMASVYAITGGLILLSDDMSLVEQDRLDLAERAIKLRTDGCTVPDLMGSAFPETAVATIDGGFLVLAANWEDRKRKVTVNLEKLITPENLSWTQSITEIWTGAVFPISNRTVTLTIPPHGARLLQIAVAERQP